MGSRHSLRLRVAVAFAVFGGLLSVTQAVGLYIASRDLGERLVSETLAAELDDYIARRSRNPHSVPEETATIRAYVIPNPDRSEPMPAAVLGLTAGRHHLMLGGEPYQAAVRQVNGQRFVVLYNESRRLRREQGFAAFLAIGALTMSVLAAVLGHWLAGRVIAPVTELARRVGQLRPEARTAPMADAFPWDEVRELAHAFDDYVARLQAFVERERDFTGDVSHELRTPLAVIGGACEVLLNDPRVDATAQERVQRIARAVAEMVEITGALLILARERRDPSSGTTDAAEVVTEAVERMRALYRAKPIEVTTELAARPQVAAERVVLAMAVGNLVRNAFAYTDQGSIRVRLEADRLEIADSGPGIEPTELARIFDRHYRGAHSSGSGIGLSLVRRICERYGWTLDFDTEPGHGTRIVLRFG
jgi:signal transduction histidine kinase